MRRPRPRFADHPAHVAALHAAALRAVDPAQAVRRWLRPDDFAEAEAVYIVGAGKAGVAMAAAAAEVLGDHLTAGVMSVPRAPARAPARLVFVEGGHPAPTEGTLAAGRKIAALLRRARPGDLVLALISGGGSALLELLQPGLSLDDLRQTNAALLRSGAPIQDVNAVRTCLSQLKGGGLARLAAPARVLALILSDVVGNPLASIASGPTVIAAESAWPAALRAVERYGLWPELPPAVREYLRVARGPREAPAAAGAAPRVENRLVGANRMAGEAAVAAARELGFAAELLADDWQGEARAVGRRLADRVLRARAAADEPQCLVAGGETTVAVRGAGRGGRNQEAALSAALILAGTPGVAVATLATDGVDGPTDAAGALVTGETLARGRALGLDAQARLDDNDAYPYLQAVGALLITGPSGTNVNDLLLGLAYPLEGEA